MSFLLRSAAVRKAIPTPYYNPTYNLTKLKAEYKREKRASRATMSPENVEFGEAMRVFRTYLLGQTDLKLKCHVEVQEFTSKKPLKGQVTFPIDVGRNTKAKIMVFAEGAQAEKAKELGATIVGGADLIARFLEDPETGKGVEQIYATKAVFPQVIKIAKILGPRGLMPAPSKGTVGDDIEKMMSGNKNSIPFENEERTVTMEVAKATFSDDQVLANIRELLGAVEELAPQFGKTKGRFVSRVVLSAPNAPGLLLPLRKLRPSSTAEEEEE